MPRLRYLLWRVLPQPFRAGLWRVRQLPVQLVYRVSGYVPGGIKYKDPHAYWTKRGETFYQEDITSKAHSSPVHLAAREEFFEDLDSMSFASVLDAGCGYGRELVPLYDRFSGVVCYGIDFAQTMLRDAAKYIERRPIHLMRGSLTALPFPNNSFDISFTTSVLNSITDELASDAFDELVRVTRYRIYHREVYRKHIEIDPDLKESFDFSPLLFDHDYEEVYRQRGHRVLKSSVFAAYLEQPSREMWYSMIIIDLNKSSSSLLPHQSQE